MKTITYIKAHTLIFAALFVSLFFNTNNLNAQTKSSQYDTYKIVAYKKYDNKIISESNTVEVARKLNVHIPNAFSPDGDGINDSFKIVANGITDYHLQIFNRWGEVVFESNDIKKQWDGFYKGKISQNDAYVYVVNVRGVDADTPSNFKGTVSLLQ